MPAYTAVIAADSRAYRKARLMMRSMSNSWWRRMATAMATGMISRTMSGWRSSATVTTVAAGCPAAMGSRATSWQASTPPMARASHFICCRSRWSPRRYRRTSEPTVGSSSTANTTPSPFSVPSRAQSGRDASRWSASGLANFSERPPGAGSATCRGLMTKAASVTPIRARPANVAGRQRGDGSRPDGNSRKMAASPVTVGTKAHSARAPISAGAGRPGSGPARPAMA
jgi:hypothetical protein